MIRECERCKRAIVRTKSNEKRADPRYINLCRKCAPDTKIRNLPEEIIEAIISGTVVDYDFYMKYKGVYSSKKLKVSYKCEMCNAQHTTDFKHLNKRTVVSGAFCPSCVMKVSSNDEGWRKRNSDAQLIAQSLPEQRVKNSEGVKRYWKNNPEKLEEKRVRQLEFYKSDKGKASIVKRQLSFKPNCRGISGKYLSKWGRIPFESSYEFCFLVNFEKRDDIESICRGPIIKYRHEGVDRQYFVDYQVNFKSGKVWWVEIKSAYVGKKRQEFEKLKSKLRESISLVKNGHADKIVMITEKNAKEVIGEEMPRGSYRSKLFRDNYDKIEFLKESDRGKYRWQN